MISDDELATRMYFFDKCGKPWCATCSKWLEQALEGLKALNNPKPKPRCTVCNVELDDNATFDGAVYWCPIHFLSPTGWWLKAKVPIAEPAKDQTCKQDANKTRWSLLFSHCQEALKEVVAVRAYGESKYGTSESWREVAPERYLEAATRHVLALHTGHEINEEDGGMRHAAQAITDLLFYLENKLREERS